MASFSEIYYGNGGLLVRATNSLWTGNPVGRQCEKHFRTSK